MDNNQSFIKKCSVGIGSVCAESGEVEMTAYAIGSCIALCLYDKQNGIGSMAHILLPSASFTGHENKDIDTNTKYADHAVACALEKMYALGADKRNIKAAVIGGANMFPHGMKKAINIGQMNIESVLEELDKNEISVEYSALGGEKSRTVAFKIPAGSFDEQIIIKSPNMLKQCMKMSL